jgi:hypothetical protein
MAPAFEGVDGGIILDSDEDSPANRNARNSFTLHPQADALMLLDVVEDAVGPIESDN